MKILHINSNYDRTTLHQAMMDRLDLLTENRVFVPTHDKTCGVLTVGENVLVKECFRKWDRYCFAYKQRKIKKAAMGSYSVEDFDLIHAYTLFTDGNVAYKLHKKFGIPYAVAVRNTDVNAFFKFRPHLRGRGVKILRNAAAVFFLSESYREQVFSAYIPEEYHQEILGKTHIIPNGIDERWFNCGQAHSAPRGKELRLVFAGRIDRNKNILTSAKACELLCEEGYDASLTVIGRVADEALATEIDSFSCVKRLPPMSMEELAEIYKAMDMFLMPSIYESFGLVYAEAMSQGLPVLYTAGQGFDGQFPPGTVGYPVPCNSPEEICKAVKAVLQDYETMSLRCITESHRFRWQDMVRTYVRIYKECLK
ncbi:MAG: glycosyltransferase family 4 protein [Oscillospiraceae bacterium]|nr:glycosyltransferase family 4 protein [Oscillospiraceae bacterium]